MTRTYAMLFVSNCFYACSALSLTPQMLGLNLVSCHVTRSLRGRADRSSSRLCFFPLMPGKTC